MSEKRYIQVYTGNGKGKTTAAIGQAIRAAGDGLKTLFVMLMKNYPYNEISALKRYEDLITLKQYGDDDFVLKKQPPSEKDKATIKQALAFAHEAMLSKSYDIIILDEVCVASYFKLLTPGDLLPLLNKKPDNVELILTGRYCPREWLDKADLVTEMTEVKHYYTQGVMARKGFES